MSRKPNNAIKYYLCHNSIVITDFSRNCNKTLFTYTPGYKTLVIRVKLLSIVLLYEALI